MTPDAKRKQIADRRAAARTTKIGRDAFLYLEPPADDADKGKAFAQCSECCFLAPAQMCVVLNTKVSPTKSCGFFIEGPYCGAKIEKPVSAEAAGLVDRQVRCENCKFGGKTCALYERLNDELPQLFDLDTKIHPKGCCNANTPA